MQDPPHMNLTRQVEHDMSRRSQRCTQRRWNRCPLAEVYYHNNRKCLRYPGYNIFNEYINVAQNDMRLCKSKDNLSSELFPVMLGLTALDYRRASVGLSRRMFSSRPDWL